MDMLWDFSVPQKKLRKVRENYTRATNERWQAEVETRLQREDPKPRKGRKGSHQ